MIAERWQRLQEIFESARDLGEGERRAFLAQACDGDADLRGEVETLISAHRRAGAFLDVPAARRLRELESEPPELGWKVGPYTLFRLLGEGGMSRVYLAAREADFDHQVAIKLLKRQLADPALLARFQAERQILARLQHPHIARLYDGGTAPDGRPYFVMEAISGTPIDRYCSEQRLGTRQRVSLLLEICSALQYAHRNLVVHRDIKPANILVGEDGETKLLDFGIAKLLADGQEGGETLPGMRPLTPRYASPEQLAGHPITTASDLYSLGLVLAELLDGDGAEPDDDLRHIVAKATREAPEERYGSAELLAEDLRRWRGGHPVSAREGRLIYRSRKLLRRHWLPFSAAGLVFLLTLGFGVATARQARVLAEQRDQIRLERDKAQEISSLLIDLFKEADPSVARGEIPDALEMLDRGRHRLQRELADQPELRAPLLGALGRIYRHLGRFEEAQSLLEASLELNRVLLEPGDPAVARSLLDLAEARTDQGHFEDAEALYDEAVRLVRQRSDRPQIRADALATAATYHHKRGRYAAAEALFFEALELARGVLGDEHPDVAMTLHNLGTLRMDQRELDSARIYIEAALEIWNRHLPRDHPERATALNNLGSLLNLQGDSTQAAALLKESLEIRRRLYGEVHPAVASGQANLGSALANLGRVEEAEELVLQALETDRRIWGEVHPKIGAHLSVLASFAKRRGELEEAERRYLEALATAEKVFPNGHPVMAIPLLEVGELRQRLGRPEDAVAPLLRALEMRRAGLGPRSELTAQAGAILGECLLDLGRLEEAEAALRDSFETLRSQAAGARPARALARLFREKGDPAQAAAFADHAHRLTVLDES